VKEEGGVEVMDFGDIEGVVFIPRKASERRPQLYPTDTEINSKALGEVLNNLQ